MSLTCCKRVTNKGHSFCVLLLGGAKPPSGLEYAGVAWLMHRENNPNPPPEKTVKSNVLRSSE